LGLDYTYGGVHADESRLDGESAEDMVLRLAQAKAAQAAADRAADDVLIGADTAVVVAGRILGKPRDKADALQMLAALSGRRHRVLTGIAVRRATLEETALSCTEVRFREIHPDEAELYWQSGEPAGKAGAYAVQGMGGIFVSHLAGSYSGVVGLPVYETAGLLQKAGIFVLPRSGMLQR
jgi:septum formation protein